MYRISLIAIASLFISAVLVAKAPAAEPLPDVEVYAVKIAINAYQVGDYDTAETLFHKLSLENKKMFLQAAVVMSEVVLGRDVSTLPQTFVDFSFFVSADTSRGQKIEMEKVPEMLEQWAEQKRKQTQLLGRLTLSLFEQPAVVTPYHTHGGVAAMPQPYQSQKPMMIHPSAPQPAPPSMSPVVVPGHDDGFITLGSYGRVYIKGLEASEIIDAVKFHLSKFLDNPRLDISLCGTNP